MYYYTFKYIQIITSRPWAQSQNYNQPGPKQWACTPGFFRLAGNGDPKDIPHLL